RVAVARGGLGKILLKSILKDSGLKVWDATQGKEVGPLTGIKGRVINVAISHDGRRFATLSIAGLNSAVQLWDGKTGKMTHTLSGDSSLSFTEPVFSPDGKRLATAGTNNKNTTIWDVETGQAMIELPTGTSGLAPVQFSPDGKLLAVP